MIPLLTTLWLLSTPTASEDPAAAFAQQLAPHVAVLEDAGTDGRSAQAAIDAILRLASSSSNATPDAVLEALWSGVVAGSDETREVAANAMIVGKHATGFVAFAKGEHRRIEEAFDAALAPEEDETGAERKVTNAAVLTSQVDEGRSAESEPTLSPEERREADLRRATRGVRALAFLLGRVSSDESADVLFALGQRMRDRETRRAIDTSDDPDVEATVYVALARLGRRDGVMVCVRELGGMRTGKPLYQVDAALRDMAERRGVTPPEGSAKQARFRWSLWSRKYEGFLPESLGRFKPAR